MSRTFEVLERVQQDRELVGVPPVTKSIPAGDRSTNGTPPTSELDVFAHQELVRLVQCVFLAPDVNGRHGPRRVVFSGVDSPDSSNLLCAHVGCTLAEQVQSKVCVVNANVRAREGSSSFDLFPGADSSVQFEAGTTPKVLRWVRENLCFVSRNSVLTNGDPTALDQARAMIRELSDDFAYVVVSAPPIGLYGDTVLLSEMTDGVVLLLEANCTRRVAARKAKQTLEDGKVRVLGTVLNNRTFPIPERIYRWL